MKKHLRTAGMVLLVAVCGAVAVVVNLGPPEWLRKAMGRDEPAVARPLDENTSVVEPKDLKRAEAPPQGMRLVWRDEFTGARGASPSASRWKIETTAPDTGELEKNTRKNVALDGKGRLLIVARKKGDEEYTSARINTEGLLHMTYGRVTARIKTPIGRGLWPAFWLLGTDYRKNPWPDCGEIDIMERRGDLRDRSYATVQGPGYSGVGISKQYSLGEKKDFSAAFHVFTLDWTRDKLVFMVDGYVVQTVERTELPGKWVFSHPFFIVLNLAVGGPFPGSPDAATPFPARMLVDYVRVYSFPSSKISIA